MRYIFLLTGGLVFFLFTGRLHAQEKTGLEKTVTLDMQNVPVGKILSEIEVQAGIFFSYESSLFSGLPDMTFQVKEMPLEDCLKRLFEKLPVTYQVNGRMVILKKKGREVTINGFIREKGSSESLVNASVYELFSRKGTASNNYGFFSLSLNPGDVELQVSYIGYKSQRLSFPTLARDTFVTVELESNTLLGEVVVTSDSERQQVLSTQMGTMEFDQQTIRNTPVMFGEPDLIKTLQLTPGVAGGVEGLAGMYVRGGNLDENLFLIDGNPVYQINHLGGIFSAFNSEAIRGMTFFKAGFPARYGGRLSSVVDVYTKDGNMKEFHGSASIGLISANVSLEGPIVKDRTSFVVAFRRTWLDAITAPMFALINKNQKDEGYKSSGNYFFHDLNMKINHRFNDRSRLFVSLYNGRDKLHAGYRRFNTPEDPVFLDNRNENHLLWGNMMATAGWTYVFNPKLFGKISGFYTQYRSSIEQTNAYESGEKGDDTYLKYHSFASNVTGISDFGIRTSFDYLLSPAHRIRFGGDGILHRFRPEYNNVAMVMNDSLRLENVFTDDLFWAREFGVFAEDDWNVSSSLRINAGLRLSLFNVEGKTYISPEPRITLRWLPEEQFSLKASYSRMNQYVHLLSTSYVNLPTDAWMPVTDKLKPLVCDHYSVGLYYNLKNAYDFSVEGYYKRFTNLLDFKDGHSFLPTFTSWEDKLTSGTGRGYGMEFMTRKQSGKTTGWLGYTLSWSDRKFKEIDNGARFPSRFDNRHKLNLVVMHKLTPKIEISAAWTYSTGNRMTLSLEGYEGLLIGPKGLSGEMFYPVSIDYYEGRNNYKLPDYHRLDLGINFYRPKKKGRMGIWNVSIYNAYCRINPFMVYKQSDLWRYNVNYGEYNEGTDRPTDDKYYYRAKFKQVSVLPVIPTVSYTYKF